MSERVSYPENDFCRAVWMRLKWKLYIIYYTTLQSYRDAEFLYMYSVQNMKCLKEVPLINLLILSKVFVGSIKKGPLSADVYTECSFHP